MDNQDYWNQFMKTGNPDAYMMYKGIISKETPEENDDKNHRDSNKINQCGRLQ